jgi:serine phosphatase RsbU (regulator of sigma subunit)
VGTHTLASPSLLSPLCSLLSFPSLTYPPPVPEPLLPEIQDEFEAESLRWLRRRFLWYTAFSSVIAVLLTLGLAVGVISDMLHRERFFIPGSLITGLAQCIVFLFPLIYTLRSRTQLSRRQVLKFVTIIVALVTLLEIVPAHDAAAVLSELLRSAGFQSNMGPVVPMVIRAFIFYTAASLFIPWTPREAIIPILPLLILQNLLVIGSVLLGGDPATSIFLSILVSVLLPLPSVLICWARHSRFRIHFTNQALHDRVAAITEELSVARRIHERLFPKRITSGPVRLDYAYEPMREIGGDFVYARSGHAGENGNAPWLSLVLIDVTGHGIAAALAVNRLHGELERLFGTHADPAPGLVLAELNRYLHFAMASESVYATALAVRFDPGAGMLRWASAAHPPAILSTVNPDRKGGARNPPADPVESLGATTFLLGVSTASDFDPAEESAPFGPGASLLAYTDGAYELRLKDSDKPGEMLGLGGLTDLAARHRAAPSWSDAVLADLKSRREGPSTDDILIVQVSRQ